MNYLHYCGILLGIFGVIGGFEWLSEVSNNKMINKLSKDQIAVIIGITWVIIANAHQ